MPGAATRRPSLLDVGCAHGWFLEATAREFAGVGLEPDVAVAQAAQSRGLPVRGGFFPDALSADERFEVIVFNDVLEHIPDINSTLSACFERLQPGGVLVINAPSRRGVLYRVARLLGRLGLPGSFARLWQMGFPSPHVHYLDSDSEAALARRHGFRLEAQMALPSVSTQGLYARIRYSRDVSVPKAVALTAAVGMASPLLAVLPPDIEVWFLRRQA
ncbi:bifunctional 2-polyprenyl-6-hydroxyphenol methylase/3-demethylubiquinol 3-O-methyltransferase UbiG [Myxococcus sp. RHSTA-1-4]|uniref:class I SAM-dependent methyltransferase n=1 Tax=Myxococcus sp. RHSTA-1-4 TaxID=2874601 RepID=UPI001CBC7DBD|nr:class I SAM-dependent methyltransferase [Myxococcus sp. RHSTA-1-4]MBZ4416811.1 class I SAM-dependent methyltransferase [Myxococcus sp. RHSTA-1-4]